MICKCHVLAFFLLLSTAVSATSYRWQSSEQDPDGVFTNAVHFSVDPASIRAQDVVFVGDSSCDTVVRIPAGLDYSAPLAPHFQVAEGHSFTLDVRGASWTQPNTDSGNPYSNQGPYRFAVGRVTDYYTDRKLCLVNAPTTSGVFKIADGLLSVSNKVGSSDSFEVYFHSGTFDFVEPNGSDAGATGWFTAGGNFRMGFLGGEVRLPNILFYATAGMSEYDFTGGSHYIKKMNIRHWDVAGESDTSPHTLFNVHGSETKLTLGELGFLDYSREHAYRLAVSDGATLEIAGNVQQKAGGISDIVLNDATLALTANSTWTDARLFATNTTVRSAAHDLTFKTSRADFRECALSVGNLYIGNGSGTSCVDVAGGAIDVTGSFIIGNGQSVGSLTLSEGVSVVAALTHIGSNAGGFGCLAVSNDAELVSKAAATEIGTRGNSFVHIGEGGRFKASALMKFASGGDARGTTNILLQTGGEIDIGTSINLIGGEKGGDCYVKLELDGGVLKTQGIEGGNGCSARDATKTGIAVLSGNGGTLRPKQATSNFLQYLNRAECGARGLTVDSDYDVTIPQSFTDVDGEAGELTLTGFGVKTLSGEATDVSRIVVAGGSVVFANGARASSTLVLLDDATVAFEESMTEVGLTGLVVGSPATPGKLECSAASPLALGCAIGLNNVHLKLSGDFAAGNDYLLLSTTGTVAEGSAEAWSNALVVAANDMALSYSFYTEETGDAVSFKVAVRDCELSIDVDEGETRDYATSVSFGQNACILVNVASNATLRLLGDIAAGVLVKRGQGRVVLDGGAIDLASGVFCDEGIVSVRDASVLAGAAAFHLKDGTFEFVGDGSGIQQTLPCPLVCSASKVSDALDGIIDLKIESPLVVTNILLESGCIFKRGVGTLTFAAAPGLTMALSVNNGTNGGNGMPVSFDVGNIASDAWSHPTTGYSGFNVAEGEVVLAGDGETAFLIPHKVSVGLRSSGARAIPSLVVDGARAELASQDQLNLSGPLGVSGGLCAIARISIVNGANVTTRGLRTGGYPNYVSTFPTAVVDRATWTVSSSPAIYGTGSPQGYMTFVFRNGARCYFQQEINQWSVGGARFILTDSILAKSAALDPIRAVNICQDGTMGGYWLIGSNVVFAAAKIGNQHDVGKYGNGPMLIDMDGGEWRLAPYTLHLTNASQVVMTSIREAGATLYAAREATVCVARAITGPGGIAKTGEGGLRFEVQGEWTGDATPALVSNLTDSVSLAFEGLFDVREGSAFVERGACRSGGAYRAGLDASIDFDGNDLGSGASFRGSGTFLNASATDSAIRVPLDGNFTATDGCPAFDGVSLKGRVRVEFELASAPHGRSREITVARFSEPLGRLSNWSDGGVGKGYGVALVKSSDGKSVLARIAKLGIRINLR